MIQNTSQHTTIHTDTTHNAKTHYENTNTTTNTNIQSQHNQHETIQAHPPQQHIINKPINAIKSTIKQNQQCIFI